MILSRVLKKIFLTSLLVLASSFFLFKSTVLADFSFEFEFYNTSTNRIEKSLPFNANYELIVASQTQDVRKILPIEIKVRVGSKQYTNTIPANPEKFCRGFDGCSIPGPKISEELRDQPVEIWASSGGKQIAYFGQNTPSPTQPQSTPPLVKLPEPSTQLASPAASAPTSTTSTQTAGNNIDGKKISGGALVVAGLSLLWWELISKKKQKTKPCPQNCRLGDCTINIEKVSTSTFGWTPEEEKSIYDGLDLTGYLRFSPRYGIGGISAGGKGVKEAIERAKEFARKAQKEERKRSGVNLHVIYSFSKCVDVNCDADQKGTDWDKGVEKTIQIPSGRFSHVLNEKGWDEHKLLDPKYTDPIKGYIVVYLEDHAPKECVRTTVS